MRYEIAALPLVARNDTQRDFISKPNLGCELDSARSAIKRLVALLANLLFTNVDVLPLLGA